MRLRVFDPMGDLLLSEEVEGVLFHRDGSLEYISKDGDILLIHKEDYKTFNIL